MGILKTQVAKAAIGLVPCAGAARWSALERRKVVARPLVRGLCSAEGVFQGAEEDWTWKKKK